MKGKIFYLFLSAILSIVFINEKLYFLLLIQIIIMFFCFKKFDIKHSIALLIIFLFFCFYKVPTINYSYNNQEFNNKVRVTEVKETYIIVKDEDSKYIVYYDETDLIDINDTLLIQGQYQILEKDLDIDVFEFKDYLNNKRIYYQIVPSNIEIIKKDKPLYIKIIESFTKKLEDESLSMTMMLLFNDKTIDKENYESLKKINAVHLFVVSGFHINFIFSLICKIFKKKKIIGLIISFIICIFYIYLLNFSISSLRALISLFLYQLFFKYLNRLDCLSISGIILLVIEPLNVFNYSFIMSFLMATTITLCGKTLKRYSKVIQTILLSIICFLVMIPVQLSLSYELNFLSLISNIILSYVVMIIFILCVIGIILMFVDGNIFGKIYEKFNDCIEYLSELDTTLTFGYMNVYLMVLYYALLIIMFVIFEKYRLKKAIPSFSILLLFLVAFYNKQHFTPYQQVTFLNVYQGDCCIIQDSFTGKVMLIDTGGLINYDIAQQKIIPYLKYHGIRNIDIVVISHNDYDHCGALENLGKQISISTIIEDNNINEIELGKIKFKNLNKYTSENNDKNDNSIVLYSEICGYNFLFTGDISSSIEKQIINDNPDISVDVLKVAHHGSKTSSCEEFISTITPQYAIISVGENNNYGHPDESVINRLKIYQVTIYQTAMSGTIRFKGKIFDFCFIETAK